MHSPYRQTTDKHDAVYPRQWLQIDISMLDLGLTTHRRSLYQPSSPTTGEWKSRHAPPDFPIITQKMSAMIPQFLPLGMSSPASTSSAFSYHPVLSRASSQTSLTSSITTESVSSNDGTEPIASSPVRRICFVGGGYVGKSDICDSACFAMY